jgi:hypothetical protein
MKKIYIGLLLLLTLTGLSCNNGQEKCGPCPLAAIYMIMKVRIVDKTTGADLFLSSNSPYKPSDLTVSSSADPNFQFRVDSVDTNNRFLPLPDFVSATYTLKLATLSADNIKVDVGPGSQKCCATNEVKSIMINDSLVCRPCSPQQLVVIKK